MPTDAELKHEIDLILNQFHDPYLDQDLITAGAVKSLQIDQGNIALECEIGYPAATLTQGFAQLLQTQLEAIEGVTQAQVEFHWSVTSSSHSHPSIMGHVKNIVAVASCKGGVGKSTVTSNLALALAQEGAKVGLLDADIYGPSQGLMLGVSQETRPETIDNKVFVPISVHGIKTLSMAYLVTDKTPMVWRGPMVSGALQQLMTQTHWGELDYLFIDMPPGTGDIQLTLSQKFPVSGAVIVTTPQEIALLDAKKGIEMFRKVKIPVLGIVENMASHICRQCGHHEAIFGEAGADQLAAEYQTEVLGSLPLSRWIREQADLGVPSVVQDPESAIAQLYKTIARTLAARLGQRTSNNNIPTVEIS